MFIQKDIGRNSVSLKNTKYNRSTVRYRYQFANKIREGYCVPTTKTQQQDENIAIMVLEMEYESKLITFLSP
jgi:hypothetical protein